MTYRLILLSICCTILFASCSGKCSDAEAPEAPSLFVAFVDQTSEENVFTNETFTANQITITDTDDNEVPFNFLIDRNVIHIIPAYKNISNGSLVIALNNPETMIERTIEIQFAVVKQEKECYTLHSINNVVVPNNESAYADSIYTIKI